KKQIKGRNRWGGERTKWWLAGGFQNGNSLAVVSKIDKIRMIHDLCSKNWQIKFQHIQRDGNKVTGHLAKVDGDKLDYLVILDDPLHFVIGLLEEDIH
ncbi:hypothetical protein Gogos_011592, partial [Gossypium gossypioides]|nr:hypothetical protein [Gossypium gossypioides]